jgi:hypothetical protein
MSDRCSAALIQRLVTKDPDLIVGWITCCTEDVPLLREAARRCRMSLPLARGPGDLAVSSPATVAARCPRAVLSGRVASCSMWRRCGDMLKGAGHEDSLSALLRR